MRVKVEVEEKDEMEGGENRVELEVEEKDWVKVEVEEDGVKVEESMEVLWGRRKEEEENKFNFLLYLWYGGAGRNSRNSLCEAV